MTSDRIDGYLDEMHDYLEGTPVERLRMLGEAETHLRDSVYSFQKEGMEADAAQIAAIAAFGDAPMISASSNRRSPFALFAAFVRTGAQLGLYGFVAIALAALLGRGLALLTSIQWVYGAPVGYRFTAAQCEHWLVVQPTATTCRGAATLESADDSFLLVISAAVIGLVVAGAVLGVMRFTRRPSIRGWRLPQNVVSAIGATAFLGAGVALAAAGVENGIARGVWGQGILYADGVVALIFGVVFLIRLLLKIRPVSPMIAG
ncbi:hypothetical protein BH11ACT3_BH11ACT3_21810 [soil metagenome]